MTCLGVLVVASVVGSGVGSAGARVVAAPSNGEITFFDYARGTTQLVSIQPDGSGRQKLSHGPRRKTTPAWSPDGARIAFSVGDTIWITDPDGANRVVIGSDLPKGIRSADWPSWSPDGNELVFEAYDRLDTGRLYTVGADGSALSMISRQTKRYVEPAWSPDGTRIAFRTGSGSIATMAPDGSDVQVLTSQGLFGAEPAWSPDGTALVYALFGRRLATSELFVIDADGSHRHAITHTRRIEYSPAWAPDGTRIVFSRTETRNPFAPGDLWTIDPDGSNPVQLTDTKRFDEFRPSWRPIP
jgi:TolB protein